MKDLTQRSSEFGFPVKTQSNCGRASKYIGLFKSSYKFLAAIVVIHLITITNSAMGQTQIAASSQHSNFGFKRNITSSTTQQWSFRKKGDEQWLLAQVPGCVHTDLMRNNLIPDPFIGLNEEKVQWVENEDWEYRTSFQLSNSELKMKLLYLNFIGLDTYADVYLNKELILQSDNMFRSYRVDVKKLVRNENTLHIHFHSPVRKGKAKLKSFPFLFPVQNEQAPMGEQTNIYSRKAPFHYGWDWGPRLVTSGVWQPIELIGTNLLGEVEEVYCKPLSIHKDKATYEVQVNLKLAEDFPRAVADLYVNDSLIAQQKLSKLKAGSHKLLLNLNIDKPRLWWSHGLGESYRYALKIVVRNRNSKAGITHHQKLGVCDLKVERQKDDKGTSFYVKLNGVPVFIKGANYIPGDNFISRVVEEKKYDRVIKEALDANMNGLRIWGGAIYETEEFYEKCADAGLLLWQDFMFACSMYPADSSSSENIRHEAIEQVKRLRKYPNIYVWAGNNETFSAWHHWQYSKRFNLDKKAEDIIWSHYLKIFDSILPHAVLENDPGKLYWSSSPQSDHLKDQNEFSGDQHFWEVWFGGMPFSVYGKKPGRFISEYGFQSYPSLNTLRKIAPDEIALNPFSTFMLRRQRSAMPEVGADFKGNHMIDLYLEQYYPKPLDFGHYVYATQLLQADAITAAAEAHRSNRPYTMGSLFWQLNDCWPTISWSTVDYYGNWKASQYAARDAYQDQILVVKEKDAELELFAVSDKMIAMDGELTIELKDFDGRSLFQNQQIVQFAANSSLKIWQRPTAHVLQKNSKNNCYLHVTFKPRQAGSLIEKLYYFAPPKDLALPKVELDYKLALEKDTILLTIESSGFSKNTYVYFEGVDTNWSRNFLDIEPKKPLKITAVLPKGYTLDQLQSKIRVINLNNLR
jgi:beta-mannosidase